MKGVMNQGQQKGRTRASRVRDRRTLNTSDAVLGS